MKKLVALGVCLLAAGLLAGCENAARPPAAPLPISVMAPTASNPGLDAGQMLTVTATVANDSSNKGVTWTCMFTPSGGTAAACASTNFPSTTTNCSTCMATFTAPSSPGSVSITATSIADSTKSSAAPLTFKVNATPSFPAPSQVVSQLSASSPSCNAANASGTVTLGATAGTAFNCNFAPALSGGTPPITWSAMGLPTGMMFSSTGVFSGTPTGLTKLRSGASVAGRVTASSDPTVMVTAVDNGSPKLTMSITIAINVALGFTNVAVPSSGTAGQPYTGTVTAGGGTTPYHWTVSGLPTGLSSNAASATTTVTISGTPTQSGNFTVMISVTDSAASPATVSTTIMLTVAPAPPLAITTSSLPTADVNLPYSATLQATGGIPPDTWSAAAGTLPAGLTLSPAGQISGTPTMAGTFGFIVQVADSETPPMTATKSLSITINPQLAVTTTSPLPDGTVGTAYSDTLASSGGTSPVTWAVTTGTLPAGLILTPATGAISGTPTTAGTSTFTVRATDHLGQTATQSLSITVHPAPLSITTTTLPNGTVNTAYSQTVSATGGTPPYTFSLATGSMLPAGLNLTTTNNQGVISGTPTATGTFPFTIQVMDSANPAANATQALSITINTANNNAKLSGDFALQFRGFADSASPTTGAEVAVVGRFHADGNGNLTNGVLDFNTPGGSVMTTFTGTYSVGGDNRCTLTANLATPPGGTFTARCVLLVTPSETKVGHIIEFDDSNGMGTRGSGEIHKQNLAAANLTTFAGDFAMGLIGDFASIGVGRLGVVGRFTLGTTGTFSAGFADISAPNASFSSSLPGQLAAPDPGTGRGTGTVTITVPPPIVPMSTPLPIGIAYYVVGNNRVFVIVSDQRSAPPPALPKPLLSGEVRRQQQATFTLASLTGPIVFALAGVCGSPNSSTAGASVVVGQTVANGVGGMFTSGFFDQNECGAINSRIPLTATYTVDPMVKGRVTVTLVLNVTQAKPLMLYLYDINKGFLLEGIAGTPGTEVAFGIISPQTIPTGGFTVASVAGTSGFGTVAPATTNVPNESGVITLTSGTPSTFAGTADISVNASPFLAPDFALAGTYALAAADAAIGRFTAVSTVPALPFSLVIYAVDVNGSVAIDVRSGNVASPGVFFEK